MKSKIATLALASMLALGTVGCAQPAANSSSSSSSSSASSGMSATASTTTASLPPMEGWTSTNTAEQAAAGAKLEKFGVPAEIKFDNTTYANPTFGYSGGTATAIYPSTDTALLYRKATADSTVTTADIDRAEDSFDWTLDIDGVTVICYGPARGAAHAVTWEEGGLKYGVVRQGGSVQKPTMDSMDAKAVVQAIRAANGATVAEQATKVAEKKEETTADESVKISEDQAKAIALKSAGLGDDANVKISLVQGTYNKLYLVDVSNGSLTYQVCIDATNGNVYSVDLTSGIDYDKLIGEQGAVNAVLASLGYDGSTVAGSAVELVVGGGAACYEVTINFTDGSSVRRTVLAYDGTVLGGEDNPSTSYITHRLDEQEALNAALASVGWDDCSYYESELIVGDTLVPYFSIYIEGADGTSYSMNVSTFDGSILARYGGDNSNTGGINTGNISEEEAYHQALAAVGWDRSYYHSIELVVGDTAAPYYSVYIEDADGAAHTVNISTVDGGPLAVF
ncbi:MAG: PepSY domain-containing protein [Coriobacteriales bacterium]|nr:PepSY domain-containing protein [Coriobacteriales bacterium]